ncbi:MAG: hypothetical protein CMO60_00295 [Verrucomicrobiales bacterium]|nr:hypothetical protein [Verrucomicrobiales bacterium]
MAKPAVPIYNLYCLLSYVWNSHLDHRRSAIASQAKTPIELLVRLLTEEVRRLRQRGLERGYVTRVERLPRVIGKIRFGDTLRTMGIQTMTPTCEFSEYEIDVLSNQILKAALIRVSRLVGLNHALKDDVRQLLPYFSHVTTLSLTGAALKTVSWQRNNLHYRFALLLSGLILDQTFPSTQADDTEASFEFVDFTRDERQLGTLFEAFVTAYWTREHPDCFDRLSKRSLKWVTGDHDADTNAILPNQEIDLELVVKNARALIEVKFTKTPLVARYSTEKLNSVHLRQLYTYLEICRHQSRPAQFGTLLYAQVGDAMRYDFQLNGLAMNVRTVDLGAPWADVKASMDGFIRETVQALHETPSVLKPT